MKYNNPIIKGFNPDPSICRVNGDYYLVTSSFEFYPGVPVYHSTNLVNWKLINYCLTRKSQLDLENCRNSGGIYAPTIRYFNGVFYMTTTNTSNLGNFIVAAKDIYGEWSEPIRIDQGGIDPSLLFDEGKVYYCSAGMDDHGISCILMSEIDISTGSKLTPSTVISYGCGGRYCEAPHIYKLGDYYYLLLAEGGTEYGHMTTLQRSNSPYGPFEPCPHNPIISHRDVMNTNVQAIGHSDLFEDHNGNWWLGSLGIRQMDGGMLHNLGRETFLTPVTWKGDGWPVVGNNGRTALAIEGNLPGTPYEADDDFIDEFKGNSLDLNWNFVRNPVRSDYELHQGFMRLKGTAKTLSDFAPTFMGIRQKEFDMSVKTEINVTEMKAGGCAGITAFYNTDYYYALCISREAEGDYVKLIKTVHAYESEAFKIKIDLVDRVALEIITGMQVYQFYCIINGERIYVGEAASAGLTTEGTMSTTFTGTYLGIYAVNGIGDFEYFSAVHNKKRDK